MNFREMKNIFLILLIPIYAFSYDIYRINGISVAYQKSENLYDYVSLIIDKGYLNNNDCSALIHVAEYVRDSSIEYNIKCYPDYTVMQFISNSGNSVNILLRIRRSFDEQIVVSGIKNYDLLDIAIMERYGYSMKKLFPADTVFIRDILAEDKFSFFIQSSLQKKEINSIIKNIEVIHSFKLQNKRKSKLTGEYFLGDIPSDIFFYDFQGVKDFNFHIYLTMLYALNIPFSTSDIRSVGNDNFLITLIDVAKGINRETFEEAKRIIKSDIEISENNIYELVYKLNFLFYRNNKYKFSDLKKKVNDLKYEDFEEFILTLKPSLIFRKGYRWKEYSGYEKIELKNKVTLLFREKKESGTEAAVAFTDILGIEKEYSKMFASDMIFFDVERRFSNWRNEIGLSQSNLRIFSLKASDSEIIKLLPKFVSGLSNIDIKNVRDAKLADEIMMQTIFVNKSMEREIKIDSSFLFLTDGEFRMIANKIFSGENIIIAVESSVDKNKIAEAIENVSLLKYSRKKENIQDVENEEKYIDYAFNLKNRYLMKNKRIEIVKDIPLSKEDLRNPYYKLVNSNKTNILAIISYIVYSDQNHLFQMIK